MSTRLITGHPKTHSAKPGRVSGFANKHDLLLQYLLPLGGREGLQLKTGLIDKYYGQIEVRVPHLEMTAKKQQRVTAVQKVPLTFRQKKIKNKK